MLTHSLIHHFEAGPSSKKLQTTTEIWLLKDFKIQIALKTLWKEVKLLIFPNIFLWLFSSPEHGVRWCPSVHNFLVNTLASTNINQSAPKLVKMSMTIKSRMRSIMELIGPELSILSVFELENLPYLTLFTL